MDMRKKTDSQRVRHAQIKIAWLNEKSLLLGALRRRRWWWWWRKKRIRMKQTSIKKRNKIHREKSKREKQGKPTEKERSLMVRRTCRRLLKSQGRSLSIGVSWPRKAKTKPATQGTLPLMPPPKGRSLLTLLLALSWLTEDDNGNGISFEEDALLAALSEQESQTAGQEEEEANRHCSLNSLRSSQFEPGSRPSWSYNRSSGEHSIARFYENDPPERMVRKSLSNADIRYQPIAVVCVGPNFPFFLTLMLAWGPKDQKSPEEPMPGSILATAQTSVCAPETNGLFSVFSWLNLIFNGC